MVKTTYSIYYKERRFNHKGFLPSYCHYSVADSVWGELYNNPQVEFHKLAEAQKELKKWKLKYPYHNHFCIRQITVETITRMEVLFPDESFNK